MKLFKIIFLYILFFVAIGSISASSEAVDLNKIASINSLNSTVVSGETDCSQFSLFSKYLSGKINSIAEEVLPAPIVSWICLPFPFFICFPIW